MKGNSDRGRVGADTLLSPEINDLKKKVNGLLSKRGQQGFQGLDPATPFIIATRAEDGKLYVTTSWNRPDSLVSFHQHLRMLTHDGSAYSSKPFNYSLHQIPAGADTLEHEIGPLHEGRTYDVVFANGHEEDGTRITNPLQESDISTSPTSGLQLVRFTAGSSITDDPSAPALADIVRNEPDETTDKKDAIITLRVWASGADHTKTFRQVGANKITCVVRRYDDADTADNRHHFDHELDETEIDQPSASVTFHRHLGRRLLWLKNVISNGTDRRAATGSVDFRAGVRSQDHNLITGLTVSLVPVTGDGRHSILTCSFNVTADGAGNSPVPRRVEIVESDGPTDASYHHEKERKIRGELDEAGVDFATVGAHSLTFRVKHPAKKPRFYKAKVWVIGDQTPATMASGVSSTPGVDGPIAQAPSDPALTDVTANVVVGDAAAGHAEVTFRVWASQTDHTADWLTSNVTQVTVVVQSGSDKPIHHTVAVDRTAGVTNVEATIRLKVGTTYTWVKNVAGNDTDQIASAGASYSPIVGGSDTYSFDATTIATATLTPTAIDNKHAKLVLAFTQPTKPVLLKAAFLEISYDAGASWDEARHKHLLDNATKLAVAGAQTVNFRSQHKPNQSQMRWRVILVPYGSNYETTYTSAPNKVVTYGSNFSSSADAVTDTAAPGPATNLSVHHKKGHLHLTCDMPSTGGTNTVFEYEWQISTSSTFAAAATHLTNDANISQTGGGPISVFTGGPNLSVSIKKSDVQSLGTLYCRVKPHNRANGVDTAAATWLDNVGAGGFAVSSMDGDYATQPSAAAAPTIGAAKVSTQGIHVQVTPATETIGGSSGQMRRHSFVDYQFSNSVSGGVAAAFSWINPDTNATVADNSAFEGPLKFKGHVNLADLAASGDYTPGSTSGAAVVNLWVRAALVDVDADGKTRVGTYSAWTQFTAKHGQDQKWDGLHIKRYLHGTTNLVPNGNFLLSRLEMTGNDTALTLGRDARIQPESATRITTTTSSGVTWDRANHCVTIVPSSAGAANGIATRLPGTLIPSDTYCATFLMKRVAGSAPGSWRASLYDSTTEIGGTTFTPASSDCTGSYVLFVVPISITGTVNAANRQWVMVKPTSTGDSNTWSVDALNLRYGEQGTRWDANPLDDINLYVSGVSAGAATITFNNNQPEVNPSTTGSGTVAYQTGSGNYGRNPSGSADTA